MTFEKASTDRSYLVRFSYGDTASPTVQRYTDETNEIIFSDGTYSSVPEMEIKLPPQTGVLDEKPMEITLPVSLAFASNLSSGRPHSPIRVRVWENSIGEGEEFVTSELLLIGWVHIIVRNPGGRPSVVRLDCINVKALLNAPLGVRANHTCDNTLGDAVCQVDISSLEETGTVSAINGKKVTITGLSHTASDRYYDRGYVEYDGLRLGIREYTTGNDFELRREPPAAWLNEDVTVVPGCDGTIEKCRNQYSNEGQFLGPGYAIPAYQPELEDDGKEEGAEPVIP